MIGDVPNYPYNASVPGKDYVAGCGPTSAVDILGTYDARGATTLISSPLEDICLLHEDYMNTDVNGFGSPSDFHYGMEQFAEDRGYRVDAVVHVEPSTYDPATWTPYYPYGSDHRADADFWTTHGSSDPEDWDIHTSKFLGFLAAEIDAGRPVSITVDSGGETGPDHWMVAVGYDWSAQQWAGYNTWDSQLHWYNVDSAWREDNSFGVAYLRTVEFGGADRKWDGNGGGPDGNFGDATCWDPDSVPGANDSATFDLNNTYTVYLNVDATNIDANVSAGDVTIRSSGVTHLYTLDGDLTVADGADLTVRDMFLVVEEDVYVRDGSSLTVDQDSGVAMSVPAGANVPKVLIGEGPTSTGSLTINDSYWTDAHTVVVGGLGDGTLDVENSGLFMCDTAHVAQWSGSISDATVSGADSAWWVDGALCIGGREDGNGGWGSVTVENGGLVDSGQIIIWNDSALACFSGTVRTDLFDNTAGGVFNFTGGTVTVREGYFDPVSGLGDYHLAGYQNPTVVLEDGASFTETNVQIGSVAGMSGTVTVRGDNTSWVCTNFLKIGYEGTGVLNVLDGGMTLSTHAWLGDQGSGNGRALVQGEGSSWTSLGGGFSVGTYGTGTLTIRDGGEVSCLGATVGVGSSSSGTVLIEGPNAMWDCDGSYYVGGYSTGAGGTGEVTVNAFGTLDVSDTLKIWPGGTVSVTGAYALVQADIVELAGGSLSVGTWGTLCANTLIGFGPTPSFDGNLHFGHSGGMGNYAIDLDESLEVVGNLEVGHDSTAVLSVYNGGLLRTGTSGNATVSVGREAGSNGSMWISGGEASWHNDAELSVGWFGTGQITVYGGAFVSSDTNYVGDGTTGHGTLTVQDLGTFWQCDNYLQIGFDGTGVLNILGGATVSGNQAWIGARGTSDGQALVEGDSSSWTCPGGMSVGTYGTGSLTIRDGGYVSCSQATVATVAGSSGTITIEGFEAEWNCTESLHVGGQAGSSGGTGVLNVNAFGTLEVADTLKIWADGTVGVAGAYALIRADTVELAGGSLDVGTWGTLCANMLTGFGSTPSFEGNLYLGHSGTTANYSVVAGGSLDVAGNLEVGYDSNATVTVNNGGALRTGTGGGAAAFVGRGPGSNGTVLVTGGEANWSNPGELRVGYEGTGQVTVSGGASMTSTNTWIGDQGTGDGTVTLQGEGSTWTSTGALSIGTYGIGRVDVQAGASVECGEAVIGAVNQGEVNVAGADSTFSSLGLLSVGHYGAGQLSINDQAFVSSWDDMRIGVFEGSTGTVEITGGQLLSLSDLVVGHYGDGSVSQAAGQVTVVNSLYIGREAGGQGEYAMSGGRLSAPWLDIGSGGPGTLSIDDASADIEVQTELLLGTHAVLTAVPGATIHLSGSGFRNESSDSANLAGLSDLRLIFEGGPAELDPFEVAGKDMGAIAAGFVDNFTLGALHIGDDDIGRVQLVDWSTNQPGSLSAEALYVRSLILGNGSYLDLNGLNLYCFGFQDLGGTVDANGGQLVHIVVPGDANADGLVTDADYTIWADHYGECGVTVSEGDFNEDGCVTDADYTIWADNYHGGTQGVPEPATLALLGLCTSMSLLRRTTPHRV